MRACVVLDVGVVVDCVVLQRLDSEEHFDTFGVSPANRTTGLRQASQRFHARDRMNAEDVLSGTSSMTDTPNITPRHGRSSHARLPPTPQAPPGAAASTSGKAESRYLVRTSRNPQKDLVVAASDLVPFGFMSPSEVLSIRGRQFNKGTSLMVLDDGSVLLEKYPPHHVEEKEHLLGYLLPTPPTWMLSKLGDRQEKTRQARAESEGGAVATLASVIAAAKASRNVITCSMCEVQLLPMLSSKHPTPPLRVGSYVKCRRRGAPGRLHSGVIRKASYHCAYTVQYNADSVVERGVLHNDVLLVSTVEAEDVGVRDEVYFAVARGGERVNGSGTVIIAAGGGVYHVYGQLETDVDAVADDANPSAAPARSRMYTLTRSHITHVVPKCLGALTSSYGTALLPIFRRLDTEEVGKVHWADAVRFFSESEYAGQPLTTQEWSRLHCELMELRGQGSAVETQMSDAIVVNSDVIDTVLSFEEFEYVASRILNSKW